MSGYPNMTDVCWDHGAAAAAIAALNRAADEIEQVGSESAQAVYAASTNWAGYYRIMFDLQRGALDRDGCQLAADCRAAAHAVARADQRAREEQARRVREREEWAREQEEHERQERREREKRRAGTMV